MWLKKLDEEIIQRISQNSSFYGVTTDQNITNEIKKITGILVLLSNKLNPNTRSLQGRKPNTRANCKSTRKPQPHQAHSNHEFVIFHQPIRLFETGIISSEEIYENCWPMDQCPCTHGGGGDVFQCDENFQLSSSKLADFLFDTASSIPNICYFREGINEKREKKRKIQVSQ